MPERLLVMITLLAAVGCGGKKVARKQTITLDQVPANVMKVAKEKLPDVKFERALEKPNGEYEVIGRNKNGKVREIDIAPDGTVTEIE